MSVPFDAVSITSITTTGSVATVTVASTASLSTGDLVLIEGSTILAYNGIKSITVASGTTFTYAITSGTTSPATGTMTYREAGGQGAAYTPFLGIPQTHETVEYHSSANEDQVIIRTRGTTVTSFYGTTVSAADQWIFVFDTTTIPADGDLTATGLSWQVEKAFAGANFYIDVPTAGLRFYNGVVVCVSSSGDPTAFAKVNDNSYHYDLQYTD